MHFCFYNHGLGDTGGVRVMLDMAEMLMSCGDTVTIIVSDSRKLSFEVDKRIKCLKIDKHYNISILDFNAQISESRVHTIKSNIPVRLLIYLAKVKKTIQYPLFLFNKNKLIKSLRNINPDVFISLNMYNNLEISYTMAKIKPTIMHLHNDVLDVYSRDSFFSLKNPKKLLKSSSIVGISKEQLNRLKTYVDVDDVNLIYNKIDFKRIKEKALEYIPSISNYIVVIASLTTRKKVERVVEAMQYINSDVSLVVLGDGPRKDYLVSLIDKLNLNSRVELLGFISNPYPYIKHANALVLSSDNEGLPTVLIEAISLGTPCISTNCPTGPSEILTIKNKGFLIDLNSNVPERIAEVYMQLYNNDVFFDFEIMSKFDVEVISKQWYSLFDKITK